MMQALKEIKMGRLVLAVVVTLLVADTVPHPRLSAGVIENSLQWMQTRGEVEEATGTAIADKTR